MATQIPASLANNTTLICSPAPATIHATPNANDGHNRGTSGARTDPTLFYATRDPVPAPEFLSIKKSSLTCTLEALMDAFVLLHLILPDKKKLLCNTFAHHLHNIYEKSKIARRFDNDSWIPHPLKTKPFLNAPDLADTDVFCTIQVRIKVL